MVEHPPSHLAGPASPTSEMISRSLHDDLQQRLRAHRDRVPSAVRDALDAVYGRLGVLTDDASAFAHPLIQPLVTFPLWVADSVGLGHDDEIVRDLVESTLMGYLYVRVHDDYFDEGLGDVGEFVHLADSCLIRHQRLLAQHHPSPRFWDFHEGVAARYGDAMLLEARLLRRESDYGEAEFDRVLERSEPVVLAGALLYDRFDRWGEVDDLLRFVHLVVRAGQIVDDAVDCRDDVAAGNYTWVARRLGAIEHPDAVARALIAGGIDDLVALVERDLAAAEVLADRLDLRTALTWLGERRSAVRNLAQGFLLGVIGARDGSTDTKGAS